MTPLHTTDPYDALIVGGSAAGLSAALALGRSRRRVVVVDGGQPRNATSAHMHGVLGHDGRAPADFLASGRADLQPYDVTIVQAVATAATQLEDHTFAVNLDNGSSYRARTVLAATGVRDELPDIPGVRERWGIDVLHCPYCHGWEVRDQHIAVLMTTPMAPHSALLFRQLSAHVTVVLQADVRPTDEEMTKLTALDIAIVESPAVEVVVDEGALSGLRLDNGEVLPAQAVVVAPTVDASSQILSNLGLHVVPHPMGPTVGTMYAVEFGGRTSIPGVWAAGNVVDPMATVAKSVAEGYFTGTMINADLVARDAGAAVGAGY